jgi:hypothetical protein
VDHVGKAKDAIIMGHNDHRTIRPNRDRGEQFHDGLACLGIQGAGRFVADD